MNVDYFSYFLIEFLVSQIDELLEVEMVVSKPEFRRERKRGTSETSLTP